MERQICLEMIVDNRQLSDHFRVKIPGDIEQLTFHCRELNKTLTLDVRRRFCNRCNKLEQDVGKEPRCDKCGGTEFRLELPK